MKNKSFSKKLLYILLMLMMLAISLTACGEKDSDDDKDRKSRKEKSVDDDEDDEEDEEKDEDSDEDEPEATPEPTPEPTSEPTPEPTSEPTPEPVKWEEEYEDFFEEYGLVIRENVIITAETEVEGIDMEFGYAFNKNMMAMLLDVNDLYFEMYGTLDGLYGDVELEDEDYCVYTPYEIEDINEIEDIFIVKLILEFANNIRYEEYIDEVTEGNTIYDIVAGRAKDSGKWYDVECYINRETQEIASIDMQFENGDVFHLDLDYRDESDINEEVADMVEYYKESGEEVSFDEFIDICLGYFDNISFEEWLDDEKKVDDKEIEDWTTYYEGYFDEPVVFPDSYGLVYNMDMYGISIDFRATLVNGETWIRYGLGESTVDAYFDDNILLVGSTDMDSVDWALAYLDSAEQIDDIFNMDFWGGISGQIENVNYIDYISSEEINDAVYDVVEIEFADGTPGQAYINREKQSISKFSLETEGMEIEFILEDYDPIKIPYAATEAEEMSVDEISEYFLEIVEMALANSLMY